ncbi:AraC-like DNA-binding protein [Crossiella equi]|uniref:AraC-like DNA-binding protein n=1 Tax=Crossiella equi TaxID=130796 RepID=A0ABS5ABL1_9PSEU|nr:helix-turn-helix transcriptional regulator [Crossiella equi]MBP2473080.1 AraC-like DNA-binding protein [Crossiella equi]
MSKSRHLPVAPTTHRELAAGAGIDAHRHDDNQILYAATGVLSVTTDAGRWLAPATRALWVPAGVTHEHRAYGRIELHLVGLPLQHNPLRLTSPAVLAVGPLLRELIIAYTASLVDTPERRRLLAVLLDQLRRSPQEPLRLPSPRDPRLAAVCQALFADPAEDRTLGELGARAGASERTLSRLCREELGMSFPQWRTQLRLQHAVILLAEEVPVTVVAHRCGWATASAFIDVFRRHFGHTPGQRRSR